MQCGTCGEELGKSKFGQVLVCKNGHVYTHKAAENAQKTIPPKK